MINTHCRTPSPAPSMGVSTSEQLSRLRKLSVERGQCSIRTTGSAAVPSSSTAASVSVTTKPVLRREEAVDLGEVEGESGVAHVVRIDSNFN